MDVDVFVLRLLLILALPSWLPILLLLLLSAANDDDMMNDGDATAIGLHSYTANRRSGQSTFRGFVLTPLRQGEDDMDDGKDCRGCLLFPASIVVVSVL
jgi:hypothetical protein